VLYRPLVHLFGHAHQGAEAQMIDSILFSNASMRKGDFPVDFSQAVVVDVYLPGNTTEPRDNNKCERCCLTL